MTQFYKSTRTASSAALTSSATPATLFELSRQCAAKGETNRSQVLTELAASSDLLGVLPFKEHSTNTYDYGSVMPGMIFEGVPFTPGEAATAGVINPPYEVLTVNFIANAVGSGGGIPLSCITHIGRRITREIISETWVNRSFGPGLVDRIRGRQLRFENGPLSLTTLDDIISRVDSPTHLLMSGAMLQLIDNAAMITWGNDLPWYNGLPILVAGVDENDIEIIDFNITPTRTTTSIYILNLSDTGVLGLHRLPEISSNGQPIPITGIADSICWTMGGVVLSGRCAARLGGIENAPVIP